MSSGWFAVQLGLEGVLSEEDARADLAGHLLVEMGANGLEWRETDDGVAVVGAIHADPRGTESIVAEVWQRSLEAELPVGWVQIEPYADVDWSTHWKEHFTALRFGSPELSPSEALWVVPSWLGPPEGAQKILRIDPSSAFGTGIHETTGLCIDWIVEHSPSSVLDIGTGTGILAFVSHMYGASPVLGIDNDPEAVRVAQQNRVLNDLSESQLDISNQTLSDIHGHYQAVVANVLAQPLIHMAPDIVAKLAPGGRLALSGVLATQADEVSAAYTVHGLTIEEVRTRGEWVLLVFADHR